MNMYQKWLDQRWSFELISCQADGDKFKEDRGIKDTIIKDTLAALLDMS